MVHSMFLSPIFLIPSKNSIFLDIIILSQCRFCDPVCLFVNVGGNEACYFVYFRDFWAFILVFNLINLLLQIARNKRVSGIADLQLMK